MLRRNAGLSSSDDYAGFVHLSKEIMRGRNTPGQHLTVAGGALRDMAGLNGGVYQGARGA
jgi:hypothetical protein